MNVTKIGTVAAADCPSYDPSTVREALLRVLEECGGLEWVRPGMKIGIKLNLCAAKKPETAAVTHPVMAAELTGILVERGAEVVLGDSPGGPFNGSYIHRLYEVTGMELCRQAGGILNEDFETVTVSFPEGRSVKEFACCRWLSRCDAVINFSKLKSHGLMGMTAAVKNLYGIIPGTVKSEYHYLHKDPADFADMLVDLNEYLKPRLCLCDACDIMEGNGPTMGTARHMGLLLAGPSSYELDRVGAWLLGVEETEIPYMQSALRRGLLPADIEGEFGELSAYRIRDFVRSGATSSWFIVTDKDKVLQRFAKRAMYVLLRSSPAVTAGCTGCGRCAGNCPANAITIQKGKAVIARTKCVRCFCCQEFCPAGAMKVKRSPAARLLVKIH